jgi:hypothetical protein
MATQRSARFGNQSAERESDEQIAAEQLRSSTPSMR